MRFRLVLPAAAAIAAIGMTVPALAATSSSTPTVVRTDAIAAAKTESAAYQQYYAYATAATQSGRPDLAGVFQTVGTVEYYDHWMGDTALAGRFQSTSNFRNLSIAIGLAKAAAKADGGWAAQAPKGSAVGTELRAVAQRESADATLLSQALKAEQGVGSIPAAPVVTTVPVTVVNAPHYSGTFYQDLTSGSNSALETAAWNWAIYQVFARTAVNTGQASLAALLSGLEAQEQDQNWAGISNAAGYVNGNAMNLRSSIASEQGAINMYTGFATAARKVGDPSAANNFDGVRTDEMGHHSTFLAELQQLTGK